MDEDSGKKFDMKLTVDFYRSLANFVLGWGAIFFFFDIVTATKIFLTIIIVRIIVMLALITIFGKFTEKEE